MRVNCRVPTTPSARMLLKEAGLGEKSLIIDDINCDARTFRQIILNNFPKLKAAGGFELLRCMHNSRELEVLPSRIAGNPRLLKCQMGQGKIYIRPLQRDLSLDLEEEEDGITVMVRAFSNYKLGCK